MDGFMIDWVWNPQDKLRAKGWIDAENKVTFGYLDQIPVRAKLKERLTKLWNFERYSSVEKHGSQYFYYKNDGLQNQSVIYMQKGLEGAPSVLIDPNTFSADGTTPLLRYRAVHAALAALVRERDSLAADEGERARRADYLTFQLKELETSQPEEAHREQVQHIQESIHRLTRSIRTICGELRPPTLVPFGLEKTIRSHVEQFQEAHPELAIKLDLEEDGQTLSEPIRIVLFRIFQAALNNILRHSEADQVKIQFRLSNGQAILKIQDNGKGFTLPERWIHLVRLVTFLFLFFGYLGVPVPFSLMAGVFVGALLTDVSLAAIIQKIFNAVPVP